MTKGPTGHFLAHSSSSRCLVGYKVLSEYKYMLTIRVVPAGVVSSIVSEVLLFNTLESGVCVRD